MERPDSHTRWFHMRTTALVFSLGLLAAACGGGTSVDTTVAPPAEESTTTIPVTSTSTFTTSTSSTTSSSTTSTTTPPQTSTTEALPEFPPGRESLEHGGDAWVVILAASTSSEDPLLASAALDAEAAGYLTGVTDCDVGVVQALGLSEDEHYYSVSVYLENETDANQARDAFVARGLDGTVAQVQTFCLD